MDSLTSTILLRLRAKHLLVLVVLGRVDSMRAAADELNLTQPAVTKIIQDIEDMLDVTLFERRSTGIVPTPICHAVMAFANNAVSDVERFAGLITNLKLGGYGSLALGTMMAGMQSIVPQALGELKKKQPLMTIHLLAATSDKLLEALQQRTIEIAVGRLTDPRHSAAFEFEPLANENIWVFVRKGHELTRRKSVSLVDLYNESWVLQPPRSPLRQMLQASFADVGIGELPNWIETVSIYSTLKIIQHTDMVAALPSPIVQEGIDAGNFVRVPLELSRHLGAFGIVSRRGEKLTENAELFACALRESVRRDSTGTAELLDVF